MATATRRSRRRRDRGSGAVDRAQALRHGAGDAVIATGGRPRASLAARVVAVFHWRSWRRWWSCRRPRGRRGRAAWAVVGEGPGRDADEVGDGIAEVLGGFGAGARFAAEQADEGDGGLGLDAGGAEEGGRWCRCRSRRRREGGRTRHRATGPSSVVWLAYSAHVPGGARGSTSGPGSTLSSSCMTVGSRAWPRGASAGSPKQMRMARAAAIPRSYKKKRDRVDRPPSRSSCS